MDGYERGGGSSAKRGKGVSDVQLGNESAVGMGGSTQGMNVLGGAVIARPGRCRGQSNGCTRGEHSIARREVTSLPCAPDTKVNVVCRLCSNKTTLKKKKKQPVPFTC